METNDHKEDFLQFLWKFQLFNPNLETVDGKKIVVFSPGQHNQNEGPDFLEAKLLIEGITWCGSVEVHVKSSQWLSHKHQHHKAYDNTILHVVWKNDQEIKSNDGSLLPTLEVKKHIDLSLVENYKNLLSTKDPNEIPCSFALPKVPNIKKDNTVQRALFERLEQKINKIPNPKHTNYEDEEELCYRLLLKAFGFKVNEEAFQALSFLLPYKILKKHLENRIELEALLFGVSGFLEEPKDAYHQQLHETYRFLKQKHVLGEMAHLWKKLRTRPQNFPCVRLAQLAACLFKSPDLMSQLPQLKTTDEIKSLFSHPVSSYWLVHLDFGKPTELLNHSVMGSESINSLAINVVAPLKIYFGKLRHNEQWVEEGLALLEAIPAEKNNIVSIMRANGFEAKSASQSQGLIQLNQHFCSKKKCLNCAIGKHILTKTHDLH